ncbi:MAG: hypothetical protein ChlgKO_08240 [Chlamydiales bacterium]
MVTPLKSAGTKRTAVDDISLKIQTPAHKKRRALESLDPVEALMEGIKAKNYVQVYKAKSRFHWTASLHDLPQIYEVVVMYYESRIFEYLEPDLKDKPRLFLRAIECDKKSITFELLNKYQDLIKNIHQLIFYRKFIFVRKFIDLDKSIVLNDQYKLLECAGFYGSVDLLHYMLDQVPVEEHRNTIIEKAFFTALTHAGTNRQRCMEVFQYVLGSEVIKDFRFQGESPLYKAAELGLIDIVKNLLKSGHNVNEVAENGYSSLDTALIHGHFSIAKLLLESGARVDVGGGVEAIFAFNRAIKVNSLFMMRLIYKQYGQAALVPDEEGNTATCFAVYEGFVEGLRFLKSEGLIDLSSDQEGYTPIDTILVSDSDRAEWETILGKLIQWKKDFLLSTPLPENIYGETDKSTYMHRIVEKGYKVLTAGLLIKQKKERPLLQFVQEHERGVKHGKPKRENLTELRDGKGNSIMHTAVCRGDTLMMQVLNKLAPELLETKNNNGKSPKDLFRERQNESEPS